MEWSASDIGAPSLAGFTSYSDGLLSVDASGSVWGTSDQFRFVYQPVSGDCDISARVADVSDTNPKAKAGLMIRETLASNSPHYFLLATPEQGVFLQSRADPAGSGSVYLKQTSTLAAPIWLRLKRSGTTLIAYTSADGINWTVFTTVSNLTLSANAYVGFALTGSNATTLGAAEFDSISLSPSPPTGLITTPLSDTQIALNWTGQTPDATAYGVDVSADSVNWTTLTNSLSPTASQTAGAAVYPYIAASLAPATSYAFRVRCTDTSGTSANSSVSSATTGASLGDGIPGWWRLQYFGNGLSVIPGVSGAGDDPNHDGVDNLLAYATGLSPVAGGGRASSVTTLGAANTHLTLAFNRLNPATLGYRVEASADLANWSPIATLSTAAGSVWTGPAPDFAPVVETGTGPTRAVLVTDPAAMSAVASRFLRLGVF